MSLSSVSKAQQTQLIKQHIDITQALEADAKRLLKAHRWQLMNAVDAYYEDAQAMANAEARERKSAGSDKTVKNLGNMFDHYAGKGKEQMDFDATQAWANDLAVELDDVVLLAIAELTKAPTMGYFDRKEWVEGWKSLKKDSIELQKNHLASMRKQLQTDHEYFTKVYNFCFDYAKESGQKSLSLDIAASLWPLLFASAPPTMFEHDSAYSPTNPSQQTEYLEAFTTFLRTEKNGRSVSKDVWQLFLEFSLATDPKFEKYDPDAAWPSLIDEFVEYAKAQLAEKGTLKSAEAMEE